MNEQNIKIINIAATTNNLDDLIIKMLSDIDIKVDNLDNLNNLIIERDHFINNCFYPVLKTYIPLLKDYLKSSSLTGLHSNSEKKQRYPSINIVRQVLKCRGYKLVPMIVSQGYDKSTGRKKTKRYYKIIKMKLIL